MTDITLNVQLVRPPIEVTVAGQQGLPADIAGADAARDAANAAAAGANTATGLANTATTNANAATAAATAIVNAGLLMIPDRQTGAAFTVGASNYGGVVERENAAANTTTLRADAPIGSNVVVAQLGAGQTTLTAASGATLVNASGLFKTRALYSEVSCRVTTNAGGAAAVWLISGDLA